MTELVSLSEIKTHLRLDESDTSEDADLEGMILAARRRLELHIGQPVVGDEITLDEGELAIAGWAVRLIVGDWYVNREAGRELPQSAIWLLEPLVDWSCE